MNLKSFAEKVAGWGTLSAVSFGVDEVMWPAVVLWQGPVAGGVTMFMVALLVNLILIWAYDKIKKDVFSLEALRELTEQKHAGLGKRILVWFIKLGKVPAFIAISLYDPFLTVIYMRKGACGYKMEKRDWVCFALSMILACGLWTAWWQGIIVSAKTVWSLV